MTAAVYSARSTRRHRSPHAGCGVANSGDVEALDHRDLPPAGARHPVVDLPAVLRGTRHLVVRPGDRLPNFPKVDSFLDFAIAGTIIQGVLFGSVTGGAALATDIENGFFDRLLATPTSRISILLGRLAGAALFGAFQALFFVLILLPFGVESRQACQG